MDDIVSLDDEVGVASLDTIMGVDLIELTVRTIFNSMDDEMAAVGSKRVHSTAFAIFTVHYFSLTVPTNHSQVAM